MRTIATFSKPEEAHLFRTRLEAAGIPAFVFDENIVQIDWLVSNAIGGVRVQIADEDVEDAREFLAADTPQECPEASDVVCPSCGSKHTAQCELPRRIAFLCLFLFRFPLLLTRRCWRCCDCHHLFRVPSVSTTEFTEKQSSPPFPLE